MLRSTRSLIFQNTRLSRPLLQKPRVVPPQKEQLPIMSNIEKAALTQGLSVETLEKRRDRVALDMIYKEVKFGNQPDFLKAAGYRSLGVYEGDLQDYIQKYYDKGFAEAPKRTDPKYVYKTSKQAIILSAVVLFIYTALETYWVRKQDKIHFKAKERGYFKGIGDFFLGHIECRSVLTLNELQELVLDLNYNISKIEIFGDDRESFVYIATVPNQNKDDPPIVKKKRFSTFETGYILHDINKTDLLMELVRIQEISNLNDPTRPAICRPVNVRESWKTYFEEKLGTEYESTLNSYLTSFCGVWNLGFRYSNRDPVSEFKNIFVFSFLFSGLFYFALF